MEAAEFCLRYIGAGGMEWDTDLDQGLEDRHAVGC